MLEPLSQTPPTIALFLGFFMALSLKRSRIMAIVDHYLPKTNDNK